MSDNTTKIAVIGLGSMGSMLARTLVQSGHDVTVWNRDEQRRNKFADICKIADDAATAIIDAELIITCLASYDATYAVMRQPGVTEALHGKTLVQMSTATPDEARAFGTWAQAHQINYLDAKIAVTPPQIGAAMAVIFTPAAVPYSNAIRQSCNAWRGSRPLWEKGWTAR